MENTKTEYSYYNDLDRIAKLTLKAKEYRLERDLYRNRFLSTAKQMDIKTHQMNSRQWIRSLVGFGVGFLIASGLFWGSLGIYKLLKASPYGVAN